MTFDGEAINCIEDCLWVVFKLLLGKGEDVVMQILLVVTLELDVVS
jgi:hypothetical protein